GAVSARQLRHAVALANRQARHHLLKLGREGAVIGGQHRLVFGQAGVRRHGRLLASGIRAVGGPRCNRRAATAGGDGPADRTRVSQIVRTLWPAITMISACSLEIRSSEGPLPGIATRRGTYLC